MPSTKTQPKDCPKCSGKNIIYQIMRENFVQDYARVFFVKSAMEKGGLFVKMTKGWLFLPIVVFVSLLGSVCDY